MTTFLIVAALLAAPTAAFAQFGANPSSHFVPPHFNSDGSITQGYKRNKPERYDLGQLRSVGEPQPVHWARRGRAQRERPR